MINMMNTDCMEWMAEKPDNYYDLAIVDPPYGIGIVKTGSLGKSKFDAKKRFENHLTAPKSLFKVKPKGLHQINKSLFE